MELFGSHGDVEVRPGVLFVQPGENAPLKSFVVAALEGIDMAAYLKAAVAQVLHLPPGGLPVIIRAKLGDVFALHLLRRGDQHTAHAEECLLKVLRRKIVHMEQFADERLRFLCAAG